MNKKLVNRYLYSKYFEYILEECLDNSELDAGEYMEKLLSNKENFNKEDIHLYFTNMNAFLDKAIENSWVSESEMSEFLMKILSRENSIKKPIF